MLELAEKVIKIAQEAGAILMMYYKKDGLKINEKSDSSPVTEADLAADRLITDQLNQLEFSAPIISEEGKKNHLEKKLSSEYLWVVDPLDGTKSFINQSDEFAVSIGLLKNLEPAMGILYLPVQKTTYCGTAGEGSFKIDSTGKRKKLACHSNDKKSLLINRSLKLSDKTAAKFNIKRMSSAGKFGLVAEGEFGIYLRNGPTCEWDTAAGQCIVEAAGGFVVDLNGNRLTYGKKDFLNPSFVAHGDNCGNWKITLKSLLDEAKK